MVTREAFTAALHRLKGRPSLENEEGDFWDVFPAVDEPGFSPLIAGSAQAAVWWTAADDAAFDAQGVLRRPLPFTWRGDWTQLQLAFAGQKLTLRLQLPAGDSSVGAWLGLLSPRADACDTDLLRLLRAFERLRAGGVIALPRAGYTQSEGWEDVAAVGAAPTAVFWHGQSHDAFDGLGQLARPMYLYWRGDAARVVEALRAQGLASEVPASETVGIEVRGAGGEPPPIEALVEPQQPPPAEEVRERAGDQLLVLVTRWSGVRDASRGAGAGVAGSVHPERSRGGGGASDGSTPLTMSGEPGARAESPDGSTPLTRSGEPGARAESPDGSTPLTLSGSGPPLSGLAGAFHQVGSPIDLLTFAPGGETVLCACGFGTRDFPEVPLAVLDRRTFRRLEVLPKPGFSATCGGAAFLPDARLLVAWNAYDHGQSLLQLAERTPGAAPRDLLKLPMSHLAQRAQLSVDRAGKVLVVPTRSGLAVHGVGAPGQAPKPRTPGVKVRRAHPQPPAPWEELARLTDDAVDEAYGMVAVSPDGRLAARTANGAVQVVCFDLERRAVAWRAPLYDTPPGPRGVSSLAFTPWGQLAVLARASREERDEHALVLLDAKDGERRWRPAERALSQATAVACHPQREVLVVGTAAGRLGLVALAGERLDERPLFRHGGVSALAFGADGCVVAGSSRGELALLFWQ